MDALDIDDVADNAVRIVGLCKFESAIRLLTMDRTRFLGGIGFSSKGRANPARSFLPASGLTAKFKS